MYSDPKRIRDNRVTVRLDDYEHKLMQSLADFYGEQPSTVFREVLLREANKTLRKGARRTSGRGRALYPIQSQRQEPN